MNFFRNFVTKMNFELVDKYFLEELNTSIEFIVKIYNQKGTYEDLRSILVLSITNRECIND